MTPRQQCSLRWNNYYRHLTGALENLRTNDDFVDVSLCCDGRRMKAHKVVLSSCSNYFKEIFKENPHSHPVLIFNFIKFDDLKSIVEFMYQGEVVVKQESLRSFIQTAEMLGVQGLISEGREKPKAASHVSAESHKLIKSLPSTISAITAPTRTIESFGLNLNFNDRTGTRKLNITTTAGKAAEADPIADTSLEPETHFIVSEVPMEIPPPEETSGEQSKLEQTKDPVAFTHDDTEYPTHDPDDLLTEAEAEREEKYLPSDADSESNMDMDDGGSDYTPQGKAGVRVSLAEARSNSFTPGLEKYKTHVLFQKYFRIVTETPCKGDPRERRGGIVAKCNFCVKHIRGSIFVTSNFLRHLKRHHVEAFATYTSSKLTRKSENSEQGKFEKLLSNFIEKNQLPAAIVENDAFRQLMTFSNSKLSVPSSDPLSK